jgi:hypothetical protein
MKTSRYVFGMIAFCCRIILAGPYSGGSGTSGDPYLISNASDLGTLASTSGDWVSGKYFKQTANITLTGSWSPIGNSSTNFQGNYDGQGYKVSGLSIENSGTNQGFFGYTNGATIQNLGVSVSISVNSTSGGLIGYCWNTTVTNCYSEGSVTGYYGSIGGLIGEVNNSTVTDCYSTASAQAATSGSGSYCGGLIANTSMSASTITNSYHTTGNVQGRDYVGGLMGALDNYSTLSQCYSTGAVYGLLQTGGLVGKNNATINNSYSRASAQSSNNETGGFVGRNTGTITNSYSTGVPLSQNNNEYEGGFCGNNANTITHCFWDTQTSGKATSSGGTGKTTAEMKTLSTFTSAGWDFEGETNNGTDDYWDLDYSGSINNGYPYLAWQDGEDVSLPVELTVFSAECKSGAVVLTWRTESETENLGFIIERQLRVTSSELRVADWEEIASYVSNNSLAGHGSTSEAHDYSYTDAAVVPGATYRYRLADVDYGGAVMWHKEVEVKVEAKSGQIPEGFTLLPVYPNPFNASFTVSMTLHEQREVAIALYNMVGQRVMNILDAKLSAGDYNYTVKTDALSSGVYFLKLALDSQDYIQTQKIILLK